MTPELAGTLVTVTIVSIVFAIGRSVYARYFKKPVVDYTEGFDELGEDSPVIEALLAMRDKYSSDGDHSKALEYSTKALERCPTSDRIKSLNDIDRRNTRR